MSQKRETDIWVDCLQYANWSEQIFQEMQIGQVDCVHVTIAYHENFRETILNVEAWNRWFEALPDRICHAHSAADIRQAKADGKTAIIYGFQNPSPIEDDIGLVEIWHQLGARFMQLTYNNQSLLATGCYEATDSGVTRMGREVIAEMNRVGLVVDMSHSAEGSTLEAMEVSSRPIAITHANPASWHPARRNKSKAILDGLSQTGGMIGFSLYPHHLQGGSNCSLEAFCTMIAETAENMGVDHIGIGSDLCQDQPDSIVEWMRNGRWTRTKDFGEGSSDAPGFPPQPDWFETNAHMPNIASGLAAVGFNADEVQKIMGGNWMRFFEANFGPQIKA